MESGSDRRGPAGSAAAAIATAGLAYFGTGLTPIPWLTWAIPLPVLLLAPRRRGWTVALAAFAGYLLGGANEWRYWAADLELPVPVLLTAVLVFPLLLTGIVLLFRLVLLRCGPLPATLAFPAAVAAAEYLVSVSAPVGANWSLAPTQADLTPVFQFASLTGGWGVSFLVSLVPAAIAAVFAPQVKAVARWRAGLAGLVLFGFATTYGVLRIQAVDELAQSPRITLLSAHAPDVELPVDAPAGRALLAAYVNWLRSAPADGARIIVLPEKAFEANDGTLPGLLQPLAEAARERHADLIVGVTVHTGGKTYNTAYDLPADGSAPVVYRKHFLLVGSEDELSTGTELAFVPGYGKQLGIAICADLGRPSFGREYGNAGAGLVLAPALDFTTDAWSQSRVQLLRGVESGFSLARAAYQGYLTLSDPAGRVTAQIDSAQHTPVTSVSGTLPVGQGRTGYARWGDWFAWLSLAVTVAALAASVLRRKA